MLDYGHRMKLKRDHPGIPLSHYEVTFQSKGDICQETNNLFAVTRILNQDASQDICQLESGSQALGTLFKTTKNLKFQDDSWPKFTNFFEATPLSGNYKTRLELIVKQMENLTLGPLKCRKWPNLDIA